MKYKNNKKKAISVLSGGLDSTVATSFFAKEYDIHAITFNYGQKSLDKEISASNEICKKLGMEHTIIDIKWLSNLGNSALTSDNTIPKVNFQDIDDIEISEKTANKVWVPGRNVVFTAIATSFAESEKADIIIVGWDKEEAVTFPDNSKEFLDSFNNLISVGTISDNKIKIKAPLIDLDKIEIVKLGKRVNAPMEDSYSCYLGEDKHCGVCESCVRRKRAFMESKIDDPTSYIE
ncbi:7-cyano-7-deazaguanine synthase [bioreactor metagenome]|uniref:7-cyano-7-deazaguanine synthase n=1 Tax=bioreactor metagenome TaxID=1076179 RepID=A0A644SU30_9ZZZZ|nr:7-cyano-7-deazaguanine synthase QueC [Methanobrevibacter sp.]MEA4956265.1 7-cyano-7-deazaguanine synthase QueC [Methanobrevibacter sp.]